MAENFPRGSFCPSCCRKGRTEPIAQGTLDAARIDWSQPGAPVSTRHGDVYFAAGSGLEETRHVFLEGNDLPRAWARRRIFTIAETGFGTGLNFLAVWDLWRRAGPAGGRLHFLSVEGFPLARQDLERAHRPFPELAPLARRLRDIYPHPYRGFHRLHFDDDRLCLTLLFGEGGDMLGQLTASVDAWFLDGFSPARNPDFWRQDVLNRIGMLTRPGGTAATFTVAGAVRRGLEQAGFEAAKAPGFGHKRHMLRARRRADGGAPPPEPVHPSTALIIGAGIAGSAAACAFARRGVAATLIDPDPELLQAASGNPAGLVYPKPAADSSPAGRFHCAAFDYAWRHFFRNTAGRFRPCGVLELAAGHRAGRRYQALASGRVLPPAAMTALTAEAASEAAGVAIPAPALHFPQGGMVRPSALAANLRGETEVRAACVTRLSREESGWTAHLDNGARIRAEIAVLACANGAAAFCPPSAVPLTASRGQLSIVPQTSASAGLRKALAYGGYVSPAIDGCHMLGATYDDVDWPASAETRADRAADHERNFAGLQDAIPDFPLPPPGPSWRGRVAFRCTTADRLPLCGPAPAGFAPENDKAVNLPAGRDFLGTYKEGLYLYTGLGSRGLSTAPLLGELLASLACGDPLPTELVVTQLLHPARFLVRAARKTGNPATL